MTFAVSKLSIQDLNELETILEKSLQCVDDVHEFLKLDLQFHHIFYRVCNKLYILDILTRMSQDHFRTRHMSLAESGKTQKVLEEHTAIFQYIIARDVEGVVYSTNKHLQQIDEELPKLLKSHPEYFE